MKKAFCWLALTLAGTPLLAQRSADLGLYLGALHYFGDFAPDLPPLANTQVALGIAGRYFWQPHWSIKGLAAYGQLQGSDAFTRNAARGGGFRSPLAEASVQLEWHPFAQPRRSYGILTRRQLTSYGFVGLGGVYTRPKLHTAATGQASTDNDTSIPGPAQLTVAIPAGLGVRWEFGGKVLLSAEGGWRLTLSDHLDGASLHPGRHNRDWYFLGGLYLGFLLFADN